MWDWSEGFVATRTWAKEKICLCKNSFKLIALRWFYYLLDAEHGLSSFPSLGGVSAAADGVVKTRSMITPTKPNICFRLYVAAAQRQRHPLQSGLGGTVNPYSSFNESKIKRIRLNNYLLGRLQLHFTLSINNIYFRPHEWIIENTITKATSNNILRFRKYGELLVLLCWWQAYRNTQRNVSFNLLLFAFPPNFAFG